MGEFVASPIPRVWIWSCNSTRKSKRLPDHLLRIELGEKLTGIDDDFPDPHLFKFEEVPTELAEIAQFLQDGKAP